MELEYNTRITSEVNPREIGISIGKSDTWDLARFISGLCEGIDSLGTLNRVDILAAIIAEQRHFNLEMCGEVIDALNNEIQKQLKNLSDEKPNR